MNHEIPARMDDAPANRPVTADDLRAIRRARLDKEVMREQQQPTESRASNEPARDLRHEIERTFEFDFKRRPQPALPVQAPTRTDECPVCQGMGYVTLNVPVGHPKFGKAIICHECEGGIDVLARAREQLEQHFGDIWLSRSKKLTQYSMIDFLRLEPVLMFGKESAIDAAAAWAQGQSKPFLLLTGEYGMGKTCLACAAYVQRTTDRCVGVPIEYNALMGQLLRLQRSDGDIYGALQAAGRAPVLLLDDLGRGLVDRETQGRQRWLFDLINTRYNDELPTIITSNFSSQELYEKFDIATVDRILEVGVTAIMTGELPRFATARSETERNEAQHD